MHFLIPIGFAVIIGLITFFISANKTKKNLAAHSKPLQIPELENVIQTLAEALDL